MLGTAARMGVGSVVLGLGGPAPWGTVIVNVAGALALGVLVGWRQRRPRPGRALVDFGGIGMLGAFTTFGTFTHEVVALVSAGAAIAVLYAAVSVGLGLIAAFVGLVVGRGT